MENTPAAEITNTQAIKTVYAKNSEKQAEELKNTKNSKGRPKKSNQKSQDQIKPPYI